MSGGWVVFSRIDGWICSYDGVLVICFKGLEGICVVDWLWVYLWLWWCVGSWFLRD